MAGRLTSHAKEDPVKRGKIDKPFLILVLLLLSIGLAMLYSASSAQSLYDTGYRTTVYYFSRQAAFAVLGLGAMFLFSRIPAQFWRSIAWGVYWVSILLLLLVLVMGEKVNGAQRWISIAGIRFQPSEVAKFALILLFSKLAADFGTRAGEFKYGVLGYGGAMLGILVPLALERHLSAIMLLGLVGVIMMFISGTRMKFLGMAAAAAGVFMVVYVTLLGYAGDRITAWIDPASDPANTGYQILQSLYAIGSGGLFGLGFGKSRQKYLYLPFQYNDYIFAVVCEELGLFGALCIMALFSLVLLRGFSIARKARDTFSTMLCAGLTTLIGVQTVLNFFVVTNLLPSTGVALPFFSYGGTALAVMLGEMGIILSISRNKEE